MAFTLLVSIVAVALLFATLCKLELTAKHTRSQLRALRRLLGAEHASAGRSRSAAPSLHARNVPAPATSRTAL
jgi:hypothetical protein